MDEHLPLVLFLDDRQDRRDGFVARDASIRVIAVETAAEAIEWLAKPEHQWDEVHLDHDLNGETYCDSSRADCGMEVVRWICLNTPDVMTFVVHTHNEIAAPLMMAALEAAGYRVVRAPYSFRTRLR